MLGNETVGVGPELMAAADIKIQIPMSGAVESLNVGVAAGISIYEMKIKMVFAMLTKEIQSSIGRNLSVVARWVPLVFNKKLKDAGPPYTAEQLILLMILQCDEISTPTKLIQDAGIDSVIGEQILEPLVQHGLIHPNANQLTITEKGKQTLANLWSIHEQVEHAVFEGLSPEEILQLNTILEKMMHNCEKIVPFS